MKNQKVLYTGEFLSLTARIIYVIFSIILIIAVTRTRKLPTTAKCFNTGLILFNFFTNTCYIVLSFCNNGSVLFAIFLKCLVVFTFLSQTTVMMMAVDRLIAFNWPNKYLRLLEKKQPWKFIAATWITISILINSDIPFLCFHNSQTNTGICSVVMLTKLGVFVILNAVIPCVYYVMIFKIIRKQSIRISVYTTSLFRYYKSTSIVLLNIVNSLVTSVLYVFVVIVIQDERLSVFYSGIIYLASGLVDACSYILWFQECRLEFLKIFARCFPCLRQRIEVMRIEVLDIVTIKDNIQSTSEQQSDHDGE